MRWKPTGVTRNDGNTSKHHRGRWKTQKTPLKATNTPKMIGKCRKIPQKAARDLEIANNFQISLENERYCTRHNDN
jgi:hypothetical protein